MSDFYTSPPSIVHPCSSQPWFRRPIGPYIVIPEVFGTMFLSAIQRIFAVEARSTVCEYSLRHIVYPPIHKVKVVHRFMYEEPARLRIMGIGISDQSLAVTHVRYPDDTLTGDDRLVRRECL